MQRQQKWDRRLREEAHDALGNSFSAGTLVMTPDGLVAISTIEIGDLVLAYHETSDEIGSYPVTATMAHFDPEIVLLTIEDELIETTPEHPFYVMERAPWLAQGQMMGRWQVAEELEHGDDIRKLNGSTGDVTSIEVVSVDQWMYNLTVAEAHTFFVGQGEWLVHNAGPCGIPKGTASSILTPDRLQHASRHLTDAGILPNWSKKNRATICRTSNEYS